MPKDTFGEGRERAAPYVVPERFRIRAPRGRVGIRRSMRPFDKSEEGDTDASRMPSDRLQAFTDVLWSALVPANGACRSVQGELVRANGRLQREHYCNGMCNYFYRDAPSDTLRDTHYGEMALFLLDTLIGNRGGALSPDDVAYFAGVRRQLEPQWHRRLRLYDLQEKDEGGELTEAESAELDALDEAPSEFYWDELFDRAERCIANYCIANPVLVDREGQWIAEGSVHDLRDIFAASPQCEACGRGAEGCECDGPMLH